MNATIRKVGNDFEVVKTVLNPIRTKKLFLQASEIKKNAKKAKA